jgi:hypothetical protein
MEIWKNPDAVDAFARQHYLDQHHEEPEFHHYPHAKLTRYIAGILAAAAIRNGAGIETDVLPPAAAYHDADAVIWPFLRHKFAIPEDLAADIAARDLGGLGMPEAKIESATKIIRETSRFVPCTTDTSRCLSQADLMAGGIFSQDIVFLNGTYRSYKESKKQGNQPVPDDRDTLRGELLDFGSTVSHGVLSVYFEEDLALGPHQRNERGESIFNILGRHKIRLLEPARFARILEVNLDSITGFEPANQQL